MRYVETNSGGLQVSISSCSIKILLERGVHILYWFTGSYCGSLRGAWRITGSSGSDNRACLSSNVYGILKRDAC